MFGRCWVSQILQTRKLTNKSVCTNWEVINFFTLCFRHIRSNCCSLPAKAWSTESMDSCMCLLANLIQVSFQTMHIYVMLRFFLICKLNTLICKLHMELKWWVNIYHFNYFLFFLLFILGLFTQIAAHCLQRHKEPKALILMHICYSS